MIHVVPPATDSQPGATGPTSQAASFPENARSCELPYLDPLATLAWLAGATERIRRSTGVLVLRDRTALATAKLAALTGAAEATRAADPIKTRRVPLCSIDRTFRAPWAGGRFDKLSERYVAGAT